MCTLTLAWQVFDEVPVAVAANRDESVDRESRPPAVYDEKPLVVAPSDAEAGGTWIGANEHGVFAGITNRWTGADLAGERSRGLLVADVLEATSAAEAGSIIEAAVTEDEYDAFYLVAADESNAYCYRWDGTLSLTEFEPGVHVVVNVAVDDTVDIPAVRPDVAREQAANARAVREELAVPTDADGTTSESADDWLERAGDVLGTHEYGVCIHRGSFGTRSSSLLAVGPERLRYAFASGPPCEAPYEPVALEHLDELEGGGEGGSGFDVEGQV